MKNSTNLSLCILATVAAVSACSGEVPNESETAKTQAAVEEIVTVEAAGSQISFLQLEGQPGILIQETSSSYAMDTPMGQLGGQGLTSLEIFSALAPNQEPPEELVEAHTVEAKLLGRVDDTLISVELESSRLEQIAKSISIAECDELRRDYWMNWRSKNDITGSNQLCVYSGTTNCLPHTYDLAFIGACNSHSTLTLNVEGRRQPNGGTSTYYPLSVPPNSKQGWYWNNGGEYVEHEILGVPSSTSISYHLRTGTQNL